MGLKYTVKKSFAYAADGINSRMLHVGEAVEFPEKIVPGLMEAELIRTEDGTIPVEIPQKNAVPELPHGGSYIHRINPETGEDVYSPLEPAVVQEVKNDGESENRVKDPIVISDVETTIHAIEIPLDWKSMKWFALKALAEKISGHPVEKAEDARNVVEAEIANRSRHKK